MIEKNQWNTLNEIMGRKTNSTPYFIESEGSFIKKMFDIGNYFNDYFIGKVDKFRN
jgi:hypothetical protein